MTTPPDRPAGSGLRVEWVATPPGGLRPRRRARPPARYSGPPSYPGVPRWGFPLLGWRWPLALPTRPQVDPVQRVTWLSAMSWSALWLMAAVSGVAAVAEAWRYGLLLMSRGSALSKVALDLSDTLVVTSGVLSWLLGATSGVFAVLWLVWARRASARQLEVAPRRPEWQVVAGVLVPGWNLVAPGTALAELEHGVLVAAGARRAAERPRPSRLVGWWWGSWALSLLLGWAALLWGFRDGVQAMADGVVLHFWADVAAAACAVLAMRVITYVTSLLVPSDPTLLARPRVVGVRGAPEPPRAARPADAPR
ncbi:DUF4328 domain-containing protein [Saccharopolyspora gregorii]|uniref:DUF4328 domain-containing protein n=1 Tax=Saccharopolyspora gregorii TaxID=33914 RepID=UPI0021ABCD6C|nr:DUF4328 domain-containing protein [Saccharopolyspora gregorii]